MPKDCKSLLPIYINRPCDGCAKRWKGEVDGKFRTCHSTCPDYAEFKINNHKKTREEIEKSLADHNSQDYNSSLVSGRNYS
jgi:hypothetical protein